MSALIIGINTYASPKMQNLKGAVADAIAMKNYLENTLGLSASRIRMLTDEQATRRNIIDALLHLERDDTIRSGDAILIYYAGHGEEVILPLGEEQKKIESVVPSDFDGENVHVIPDYSLGQLVYRIGQKRGDNIVSRDATRRPNTNAFILYPRPSYSTAATLDQEHARTTQTTSSALHI